MRRLIVATVLLIGALALLDSVSDTFDTIIKSQLASRILDDDFVEHLAKQVREISPDFELVDDDNEGPFRDKGHS